MWSVNIQIYNVVFFLKSFQTQFKPQLLPMLMRILFQQPVNYRYTSAKTNYINLKIHPDNLIEIIYVLRSRRNEPQMELRSTINELSRFRAPLLYAIHIHTKPPQRGAKGVEFNNSRSTCNQLWKRRRGIMCEGAPRCFALENQMSPERAHSASGKATQKQ